MNRSILGRGEWTARLHAEVDRTLSSHGGLVLLGGEAGIGKTTLVGGVVDRARDGGARVAVGTCSSSPAAPALWPWTQIVRALRRAVGAEAFAEHAEEVGLEVDRLTLVDGRDRATDGDLQFDLFDAVASLLTALAQERPLVLALEDLHWADAGSLDLVDFVARHCWFEPILLVGTYRDTEVSDPQHPAHARMEALAAQASVIQVPGLDEEAVGHLVRQVTGRDPGPQNAADLRRRTGGNPLFVEQTARLWAGGHDASVISPGIKDTVRRRLEPLSSSTRVLLCAAAVLEAPMPLRMLGAVAGLEPRAASSALVGALSARLLRAESESRYAFVHDLVRETVLEDLPGDVARQLSAAVVAALPEHPDVVRPGDAAAHAVGAADLVPRATTRELLRLASADADTRMSITESVGYLRGVVEYSGDENERILAMLHLASSMTFDAALHDRTDPDALALTCEVLDRAARAPAPVAARVALTLLGDSAVDPDSVLDLMRRCARELGLDDAGTQATETTTTGLATSLAVALAHRAREEGDDETLVSVLTSQHQMLWRPGTASQRQDLMSELRAAARRRGDRDTELFATSMLWVTLLERGDPDYVTAHREFLTASAESRSPRFVAGAHADAAVIHLFQGRLEDAAQSLARAREGIPEHDLYGWMISYLEWVSALQRGDLALARETRPLSDANDIDRHSLDALGAAAEGRFEDALREVRSANAAGAGRAGRPRLPLPGVNIRVLAIAAAGVGDTDLLDEARTMLTPLRGTWSVDLCGVDLAGPIDYYLGRVEARAGHRDRAIELLQAAVDSAAIMGTPYWAAVARAGLLEAMGPEHARHAEVAASVAADAQSYDLSLVHRPFDVVLPVDVDAARTSAPDAAGPSVGEFRREGGAWMVGLRGGPVPIADAKGIRDLHTLLSSPGIDVPSVQLLNPDGDPEADAAVRAGGDPVLDDTAHAQYRARLNRLEEDLDTAGLDGDTARRDALLGERDALIRELRAATGLAGRPRRLGDNAERARKAVSGRIRDSLGKLQETAPALAEHLRDSVSTGASCRYDPATPVTWRLH